MTVTLTNVVFWDVFLCSVLQLLVTANIVSSLLILSTLMMETICSSEASVLTRSTRHHPRRWRSSVIFTVLSVV
jgi:hypothetical protein